jgi:hypothetical protein
MSTSMSTRTKAAPVAAFLLQGGLRYKLQPFPIYFIIFYVYLNKNIFVGGGQCWLFCRYVHPSDESPLIERLLLGWT